MMWLLSWAWSWVLAAIFCSSKHNAYGPAWSLAWILLPITISYGVQYLPLLAIISGLFIMIFGALRLTKYLTLIPWSALQWFLLGIWLIIWIQQVPAMFGLDLGYGALEALWHLNEINILAFIIFVLTLVIMRVGRKFFPKIPGAIVVTLLWVFVGRYTSGAWIDLDLLMHEYKDVVFSLFAWVPRQDYLQIFSDIEIAKTMIIAWVWVWVIALLETLISAKIAMKETRVAYDPQREVYGLGLTNMITWVVWWIPVSALVPRTTVNIASWATTKLSWLLVWLFTGIFSAFFFTSSLQYLPFAVVAGILVDIALGMINLSLYHKMRKLEKLSIMIILLVWIISYIWDPMLGILLGTVIALLTVVKRSMDADLMANVFRDGHHIVKLPVSWYEEIQQPWDLIVIKLEWELNYLSIESHITAMKTITDATTIVLWFGHTAVIDSDALDEFDLLVEGRLSTWKEVYMTGLRDQNLHMMEHSTIYHTLVKSGHIVESKSELLEKLLG